MKLETVEIKEFQSVHNSNAFKIGGITCLVGKNEAGKTAVLQALYRLNPVIPSDGKYDVTDDYPRANVEDYQQDVEREARRPAIVTTAKFSLDGNEISQIESDFGAGILKSPELTLSKGYENTLFVSLPVNERLVVQYLVREAELPTDLEKEFLKVATLHELRKLIQTKVASENNEHIGRMQSELVKIDEARGIVSYLYTRYFQASVPKFLYFDEYYLLRGQENLDALKQRMTGKALEKSDRPLLGLLDLARLKIDDPTTLQRTEALINKLEGASNHLTKKVLKYWSQNKHLSLKFEARPGLPGDPEHMRTGMNLWIRVFDAKHLVTTPLGTRSRGFVWFFSFLAWFDQQQKSNTPLILLLDEPGLFLHGRAQEDLLRYIEEELKGNHQVIYTTHSPFMVDPQHFERVRIVQDKSMDDEASISADKEGTKVLSEVLEASDDSLFPLQGALGYEIHQTLFVGPNSLVVEGVSDLLYIQTITGVLEEYKRVGLDTEWTITPVGGSEKVPTFVALLGAQKGLKIATLIDIQKKDQQTIENLYKRRLLKKQNVLTYGDFTGQLEADVEDMFTPTFYLALVNSEYAKDLSKPITDTMLTSKAPRIIVRLEEYLAKHPMKNKAQFNHYRPARYFAENVATLKKSIPSETLDRFEAAFKAFNELL